MRKQRGIQTQGRVDVIFRRASFFSPSPSANLVGVEEGHLVVVMVPFFVGSIRASHAETKCQMNRRYKTMDIVLPELAQAVYADRVRDAQKLHGFSGSPGNGRLSSVLRSLLSRFA